MEVILLERVSKLGQLGAKVRVKPGFGRNFLIPTGRALPATKANVEYFESKRAELEKVANQRLGKSKERAQALEGLSISIAANAGDEGRLFGSVGPHEIVHTLKALGHEISKSEVRLLDGPIRQIGVYEVELHFSEEVASKIQVTVISG